MYSLYIKNRKPDVKVAAFEPHPLLAECLRNTQILNPQSPFELFPTAIGKTEETTILYFHKSNSGGHSLILNSLDQVKNTRRAQVQVTPLDNIISKAQYNRVDFIKIDVQDLEDQVLLGAYNTVNNYRPNFLIECSNQRLFSDTQYFASFETTFFKTQESYHWSTLDYKTRSNSSNELRVFAHKNFKNGILYTDYFFTNRAVKLR